MWRSAFLLAALTALMWLPGQSRADDFVVVTGLRPPFSFNKGLYMDGIAVDTFENVMKMTGREFDRKNVKLVRWRVALGQTAFKKNRALLVVERTPELEKLFKWVGPIDFPNYALIGKKGQPFEIASIQDVSRYTIGAVRDSDTAKALLTEGVAPASLRLSTSYVQPFLQLKNGEVDLVAFSDMAAAFRMRKMGMDQADYDVYHVFRKPPLYFAFSKDTDDATIKLFNDALAMYKKPMSEWRSVYDKNVGKYLPKGPVD